MMNSYELASVTLLKNMEVSTNIQLFAKQWIEENGIHNTDELLSLLDRIHLPYEVVPKRLTEHESQHALAFFSDETIEVLGHSPLDDSSTHPAFYVVVLGVPLEKYATDWVGERLSIFKAMLPKLMLVSLFINLFALSIPFITMAIYDHVIGGDAAHELMGIAIGAGLLFFMMGLLKTLRSRVLVSLANRVSREISQALIKKLLSNSYAQNQQSTVSNQQNQVLLSERISGVLSGPLGSALFDIPFVLIFILAIGILAGWLVLVPVVALIIFAIVAQRAIEASRKSSMQSTIAGTNRQNLVNELSDKLIFLRSSGFAVYWLKRFEKANFLASKIGFEQATKQHKYTSIYYAISLCSTIAVMGLGIGLIFEDVLTPGGLIASMMLISRITGPAQMLANSATRFASFNQSKTQINRLLSQPSERDFSYQHHPLPKQAPSIKVDQLTFRYPKQVKPALSAVSFTVEPGEIIAIAGPSGSGKSTLLEMLAGLQLAQNGAIELDGVNLSQYDSQLFRHWCFIRAAYPDLLSLSVREWLADGNPVTEQQMIDALNLVGGKAWFDSLPNGLDTVISSLIPDSLFDILSGTVAQVLIDAKAVVYDYKLMLMDNPVPDYNPLAKRVFSQFVEEKRGQSTIVFTSHDPDLIKLADKVVILNEGAIAYSGPLESGEKDDENTIKEVSNG
ncbi:peptidase domain-containing ABC transporter [Vibrio panuliri]|uniref:ABC transporter ATP-binding protein n=1 Tax=Vibrio panuliri TaxID=1381081 RepID=A0ABX3FAQ3_9VIBR|nr:ATP-binding cassette domain-containing protein [Vibrio panuliri]KAB1458336.1 ATP-binding cassette domain-containing protein [Vibrio panuliri]OLQ86754.1 ABC transporter ATP-binding protein [Vibrio panuliri]